MVYTQNIDGLERCKFVPECRICFVEHSFPHLSTNFIPLLWYLPTLLQLGTVPVMLNLRSKQVGVWPLLGNAPTCVGKVNKFFFPFWGCLLTLASSIVCCNISFTCWVKVWGVGKCNSRTKNKRNSKKEEKLILATNAGGHTTKETSHPHTPAPQVENYHKWERCEKRLWRGKHIIINTENTLIHLQNSGWESC